MTNESVVVDKHSEAKEYIAPLEVVTNNASDYHHEAAKKILPLDELSDLLQEMRDDNKIVQCHGVFDLLHIGHIKHLNQAKSAGDILVVTITADAYVNKGPGKPYFTELLRAEALAALGCVDYVAINHAATAINAIRAVRPHYYMKGVEYQEQEADITGKISEEEEAVHAVGGQLNFTKDIVFSSSSLLNQFFSPFPPEVVTFLKALKGKYQADDIIQYFERFKDMEVMLVGEAIIDIYHYGEAIGKSGKEPILVTKYHREEMYIGGALAIANHLSNFCKKVTCVTIIGESGDYEQFIRDGLNDNVDVVFHYKKGAPTIAKRRFIEEYSSQKLFEIYEMDDCYFDSDEQKEFDDCIKEQVAKHDAVIVADYGHGMLSADSVKVLEDEAKFLAVNTQANASNHGFNCISKYKKADYVCIANRELQLNFRQKHISTEQQIQKLMEGFNYKNVVVTSGVKGSFACREGETIRVTPAFATSVKDRVGAGDAVLAVTSLFVANQAPMDLVGFIGNVVGSEAVNIMGNKSFIEKVPLMKHIVHLLK